MTDNVPHHFEPYNIYPHLQAAQPPQYFQAPQYVQVPHYAQAALIPPPPQHAPLQPNSITFINTDQYQGIYCPTCSMQTQSISRKAKGKVAWGWATFLFLFTGVFCWVPFCLDTCLDVEVTCSRCRQKKARFEAKCCS